MGNGNCEDVKENCKLFELYACRGAVLSLGNEISDGEAEECRVIMKVEACKHDESSPSRK